jgi:predicted ATP-dependent endonuclease of OLD family
MRLLKARVQQYRSIRDTGWFDIETAKTIMVGANEAGKTAILQALQHINPPKGSRKLESLRDYPRSEYNNITKGKVDPKDVSIVEVHFKLEDADKNVLPLAYQQCVYVVGRKLNNTTWHTLEGAPSVPSYGSLKKDLLRLGAHMDGRMVPVAAGTTQEPLPSTQLTSTTAGWSEEVSLSLENAMAIQKWLEKHLHLVDESNEPEQKRYDALIESCGMPEVSKKVLATLWGRLPVFVLFSNYFRVRPLIHLEHLADRIEKNLLDDENYDYGNKCLLQLLGFSARDLSKLGKASEPERGNSEALKAYQDQLDGRSYQLNAASVRLSNEIREVWNPDSRRDEAERLRVVADQQYLKVVVEDDLGVEIELDQRSEGFQWLVSFFIVFFAEAAEKHENAILLLDEPGLSLHGLKQREFRTTISKLAETNQTIYTTHSPFLVGPDELDLVRVVEMTDRKIGTKVHTTISANDAASLLPLQEALGYDLAQSLFGQQRNLVLEGLTDYWYIDAVSNLLREADIVDLNEKIALVPASSAGKVVYYATLLHAQKLKVAALLDSDTAGDQAAKQDSLVHSLGNKRILRTKDVYRGTVKCPEVEDMLRTTLLSVAKSELKWDVEKTAATQIGRPIIDIFEKEITDFSKYKLAKAFLRWCRSHQASDLTEEERNQWASLIKSVNEALK